MVRNRRRLDKTTLCRMKANGMDRIKHKAAVNWSTGKPTNRAKASSWLFTIMLESKGSSKRGCKNPYHLGLISVDFIAQMLGDCKSSRKDLKLPLKLTLFAGKEAVIQKANRSPWPREA